MKMLTSTLSSRNPVCAFCPINVLYLTAYTAKKKRATLGNPDAKDADGFLLDVDVQFVDPDDVPSREDKRRDVDRKPRPGSMIWQAGATLGQAKAPAFGPSRAMSITIQNPIGISRPVLGPLSTIYRPMSPGHFYSQY